MRNILVLVWLVFPSAAALADQCYTQDPPCDLACEISHCVCDFRDPLADAFRRRADMILGTPDPGAPVGPDVYTCKRTCEFVGGLECGREPPAPTDGGPVCGGGPEPLVVLPFECDPKVCDPSADDIPESDLLYGSSTTTPTSVCSRA